MDVGRNLTLTSEQDSDNYDSKQRAGGSGRRGERRAAGALDCGGILSGCYDRRAVGRAEVDDKRAEYAGGGTDGWA
ncbi:hypothetical protein [Klebsiella aerogenes]